MEEIPWGRRVDRKKRDKGAPGAPPHSEAGEVRGPSVETEQGWSVTEETRQTWVVP